MNVKFNTKVAKHYSEFLKRDVTEEVFTATIDYRIMDGVDRSRATVSIPFDGKASDGTTLKSIQITLATNNFVVVR